MLKPKSLLCLPCVAAMVCPGGPNAGREGSMEACGPTKRLMVVMGETVSTVTATPTTDMPGKSIYRNINTNSGVPEDTLRPTWKRTGPMPWFFTMLAIDFCRNNLCDKQKFPLLPLNSTRTFLQMNMSF